MTGAASDSCLMGIDLGAGSLKTIVIDADGNVRASASRRVNTQSPHPGWSEQDPADWWVAVCETIPKALRESGLTPDCIAAVSLCAGAHTPVLEDEQGRLLRPAILWSDQRSGEEAADLRSRYGDRILQLGLNTPTPTWTLPQLMWLRRHEPQVVAATRRLYVAKDWLRSRLTGTWETDHTEAAGTLLFDVGRNEWSAELCGMIDWDMHTLPPVVRPTTLAGKVNAAAARACGLREGTPVICGTSDTSAETFGAGSILPGDATIKLATAGTVSVVRDRPLVHPTLINYPLAVPGLWYTITATNSCASAHRWVLEQLFSTCGSDSGGFSEMDALAAVAPAGAGGLLFHPYFQGERSPYWDPLLRADFIGLTFRHDRTHVARAVYEGIAFSLRDARDQLAASGATFDSARIIGGGAGSAVWRRIVSDVLSVETILPAVTDAAYGVALLAGVGVGVYDSEAAAARRCVRATDRVEPAALHRGLYDELFGIYKDSQAAMAPINHALAAFEKRMQ